MFKKISFAIVISFALILGSCSSQPAPIIPIPPTSTKPLTPAPTIIASPTIVSPTASTGKPVYVTAFCTLIGKEAKTHVSSGTPIIITWGWDAKTEAQINDFLQNNITEITLDGKVIEGIMTDGIQKNQKSGNPEVVWSSEVGVLDQGQHTITYDVKWKKMISDGTSTYGPGSKNETTHDECQIIVG